MIIYLNEPLPQKQGFFCLQKESRTGEKDYKEAAEKYLNNLLKYHKNQLTENK